MSARNINIILISMCGMLLISCINSDNLQKTNNIISKQDEILKNQDDIKKRLDQVEFDSKNRNQLMNNAIKRIRDLNNRQRDIENDFKNIVPGDGIVILKP